MMFSSMKTAPLTRFLDNKDDIERVRQCFAGLWSLENDSIVMSAIESPELFVLKPQREGGGIYDFCLQCVGVKVSTLVSEWVILKSLAGNNIYGDNLRETLVRLWNDGGSELAVYILMQRIFPPASPCYLVREGTWAKENAVSEFGIFGAYLR